MFQRFKTLSHGVPNFSVSYSVTNRVAQCGWNQEWLALAMDLWEKLVRVKPQGTKTTTSIFFIVLDFEIKPNIFPSIILCFAIKEYLGAPVQEILRIYSLMLYDFNFNKKIYFRSILQLDNFRKQFKRINFNENDTPYRFIFRMAQSFTISLKKYNIKLLWITPFYTTDRN
uniref:Uncharacterized protein n=1 Tax=Heterorhabditis bacteriophora TaxID=37862 RepID=A0A1I7WAG6_HETBA